MSYSGMPERFNIAPFPRKALFCIGSLFRVIEDFRIDNFNDIGLFVGFGQSDNQGQHFDSGRHCNFSFRSITPCQCIKSGAVDTDWSPRGVNMLAIIAYPLWAPRRGQCFC